MAEELYGGVGGGGGGNANITVGGNTSGTLTLISSGTVTFAGGNNITLSQVGNAITISGANNAGATTFQAGVSNLGNTSGSTGSINNRLVLAGGNNITLSQSTNGNSATVTISGIPAFLGGVSTGGNTLGTTGTVSNQILFVGGANITLSQSSAAGGATITVSGGAGGAFSGGVSTQGNTLGTTGTVGNGIVFVGGNNVTLSQSSGAGGATLTISGPNTAAQTVESQTIGMSNLGNTSGTSGVASGGQVRMLFAGGNNITLSQSLNGASGTITISAPNQTVESQTIGMSNLGNTSGTSGIASGGQVRFLFAGGNNITLSQSLNGASGTITISAPNQSVQPIGSVTLGMSNLGNTSGTSGTINGSSPLLVFAGGNNVTLSQSINGASATITISGGAGGAFTGGVSTGGNTLGTTGTVNNGLLLVGGANVTLSQSSGAGGATVTISGGAGGAFSGGVSNVGNTSGTTGTVGNGVLFVGGNNITLSQSSAAGGATVTISAPSGGGAGVSSGGNTAGTTGTVDQQIIYYGGANITLSQSINGGSGTVSIIGGAGGGGVALGMTNTGNTAGTTFSSSSGTVYFQGSNNITVSNSSAAGVQTLWLSGPTLTPIGTAVKAVSGVASTGTITRYAPEDHAHVGVAGINASGTASTFVGNMMFSGTNLTLVTGGNSSAGSLGFSVATPVPIGTAVKGVSSIGSTGTITRYAPEDHQHAGVFSFGVSTGGNTSGQTTVFPGQFVLAGGNNITLSQATAAGNLATITISAGAGGAGGTQSVGMEGQAGGFTVGTSGYATGTAIKYRFVAGSYIQLSQSLDAGSVSGTLTIGGVAPPIYSFGMSTNGNTSGGTGILGVATSPWRMVLAGGNNITLSQFLNGGSDAGTITISAANQTVQPIGTNTIGASNLGNTQGTSGVATGTGIQFAIVGSNNITLSQSINGASGTISIIGGAGGAFSGGVSTGGNTSGGTGTVGSQLVFVGSNNITLSQSINGASATITISGGGGGGGAAIGMTNTGNTSGTNFTTATGTVYFQGTNNITVSNSSAAGSLQTLWISGPSGGGAGMGSGTNTSGTSGTVGAQLYIYGQRDIALSQSTNGASASLTIIGSEPLKSKYYFAPDGAASSSAMTHGSASFQVMMLPYDISFSRVDIPIMIASTSSATANTCAFVVSSGCVIYSLSNNSTLNPIIGSFGTTTHTFASNSAGNQSIAGAKFASFAMGTSLPAGYYVVGFQLSTANTSSVGTATTAIPFAISVLLGSVYTASGFNDIGSAAGASTDILWCRGVANSTITATNATHNANAITATGVSKFRGNFHVLFRNVS